VAVTGRTGTGGSGGSNGVGDVLLIPESYVRYVRLEPMDDERGREGSKDGRGSGEDGRACSLATYSGVLAAGGSGRRLGVRIRTLREGLGDAVSLDSLPDGVGEGARMGLGWVEEEGMGGGDGVLCLGGGEIDGSVDSPVSGSLSNDGRSPFSLFRSGPTAAPAGTASCSSKRVDDEAKFGDSCRISSIVPMSPLPSGACACAISFCPFSPSV
jgi:hypothetical protein